MRTSRTSTLATFFRQRPNQWIDGKVLSEIAGGYAWRTRVSNLRHAPFFMTIENRQRRVRDFVISEYRFLQESTREKPRNASEETSRGSLLF